MYDTLKSEIQFVDVPNKKVRNNNGNVQILTRVQYKK